MTTETAVRIDPETGLSWPKCPKAGCIFDVAAGKDGHPLKYCDSHRDKRPSAALRGVTAETVEELLATGEEVPDETVVVVKDGGEQVTPGHSWDERVAGATFGTPSPAPKPSAKPKQSKRERDNAAIAARLAAKPAPKGGGVHDLRGPRTAHAGVIVPVPDAHAGNTEKVALGEVTFPPARWHKASKKFLTIARKDGKPIYRYGATAAESEQKMRDALGILP